MEDTFTILFRHSHRKEIAKPAVMGIINLSPNSFYNPHKNVDDVLRTAEQMVSQGVHFIDIGAQATNPRVDIKAEWPSTQSEIDQLIPAIEGIKKRVDVLISVDTSRPLVMREVVKSGADMINYQRALSLPEDTHTLAALAVPVCLMHFTKSMNNGFSRHPSELLSTMKDDFRTVITECENHGIPRDRIVIDPGFGQGNFGKNGDENFYLLAHLQEFVSMGFPVLVGWSRKSMIGDVLGVGVQDRLFGSIAAETLAAFQGASIIRTHDTKAVLDAIKIINRVMEYL